VSVNGSSSVVSFTGAVAVSAAGNGRSGPTCPPGQPIINPSACLPLLPCRTLICSAQKEELLKLGGLTKLLALMEDAAADNEAAYAAAGCLASMAAHPKCLQDMAAAAAPVTSRVCWLRLGVSVTLHESVQRLLQTAMSGPADTADAAVHIPAT